MIVKRLRNMSVMIPLEFSNLYYPSDHPKLPTQKRHQEICSVSSNFGNKLRVPDKLDWSRNVQVVAL